ncbi:MAG: sodium-independent anion transporter [Burkholderiaceae bacterium]
MSTGIRSRSTRLLGLRVDESLYFANARFLEDRINAIVPGRDALRHVILLCSAINEIDASALEPGCDRDAPARGRNHPAPVRSEGPRDGPLAAHQTSSIASAAASS